MLPKKWGSPCRSGRRARDEAMVNIAKLAPDPWSRNMNGGGPASAEGEQPPNLDSFPSLRTAVARSHRTFDVNHLPLDLQRVVADLTEKYDRAYALRVAFTIRTAVELHRGWHMTLLTSKIMQQLKDRFDLRLTWKLGVLRLEFRLDEGNHDLSRKVPYDYDSEFQDKYTRIAEALMAGHIDVERALQYQVEVKRGDHTACSGRFFRAPPGRLVIYPLLANTYVLCGNHRVDLDARRRVWRGGAGLSPFDHTGAASFSSAATGATSGSRRSAA